MDNKLEYYSSKVIELLDEFAEIELSNMGSVENVVVADVDRHHYLFLHVGWLKGVFKHTCLIHLAIKDEKIWLQCNWTDWSVAEELIEKGVERNDIVLGFIPADQRQYTDYAAYPEVQTEETTS
jgi:hypothetical protein